jgi:hypothetical protein
MQKKIKRSVLIKKLDIIFSQYIRRRYAVNDISQCFTCGVKNEYKKQQAGHFASRRHYSTRWDEFNVQVQCYSCNICNQGMQFEFGKKLCLKYGDNFAEDLMIKSKKVVKFTESDILQLINYYTEKVNNI